MDASFYRTGLELLLKNNCCKGNGCLKPFECEDKLMAHFPYISPVCACTLCQKCVHAQTEAALEDNPNWKGYVVQCGLCGTLKSWNIRKLVPNMALASMLEEIRRLSASNPPVEEDDDEDSEATIAFLDN
jgi:hypothetical protein